MSSETFEASLREKAMVLATSIIDRAHHYGHTDGDFSERVMAQAKIVFTFLRGDTPDVG